MSTGAARARRATRVTLLPTVLAVVVGLLVPGPAAVAAPVAGYATPISTPCSSAVVGDVQCLVVERDAPTTAAPDVAPGAVSGAAPAGADRPDAPVPDGITPSQLQRIYGVANRTPPAGTAVGIVVAFDAPDVEADLAKFRATFGLSACTTANGCFRKVDQRGRTVPAGKSRTSTVAPVYGNSGWELETTLDTQAVSAMCPSCDIVLVEADSTSLTTALGPAVVRAQALGAAVISNSFAGGESEDMVAADRDYWSKVNVPVFAASGDHGWNNLDLKAGATGYNTANYPATSPSVIAVGGTSAAVSGNTVTSESAWSDAGSGCSLRFDRPAAQAAYFDAQGTRPDTHCTVGGDPMRAAADLSAMADPYAPGFPVYRSGGGGWGVAGGTSLSVQLVAAIAAYAGVRGPQTPVAAVAYGLAAANAPSGLADITVGTNKPADFGCSGERICTAAPGWDGPTGLGTPRGLSVFAPLLTLAATTVLPGGTVTASGSNFVPGETVAFRSGQAALGSAVVGYDGTWSDTITAPLGARTTLPVTVTGSVSGFTASAVLTVPAATLTASPSTGLAPGQTLTAIARNMTPGESVTFHVDRGTDVVRTADVTGVARAAVTVPVTAGASVTVTATGADSGLAPSVTVAVVAAALTVSPTTAGPGATVTVRGTGFGVGDVVRVSAPGSAPSADVTVDASGSFSTSLVLASTARGAVTVTATATSGSGRVATTTVQVPSTASAALPAAIAAGASATLSGAAFAVGETVSIAVSAGARQLVAPASVTAGATGAVSATVRVPGNACPATSTKVTLTGADSGRSASVVTTVPITTTLPAGCEVGGGATFTSASGQYQLIVQTDGNVVLRMGARAVWTTGSQGASPRLVLQSDGNLVLYAGGVAKWSTRTAGIGAGALLSLQDDGNLVLKDATGRARWSRGVAGTDSLLRGDVLRSGWYLHTPSSNYRLLMQSDGNLVLRTAAGAAVWSTGTKGTGGYATVQSDGNFVVYVSGRAAFNARTNGVGVTLRVGTDGSLAVYDAAGRVAWRR